MISLLASGWPPTKDKYSLVKPLRATEPPRSSSLFFARLEENNCRGDDANNAEKKPYSKVLKRLIKNHQIMQNVGALYSHR